MIRHFAKSILLLALFEATSLFANLSATVQLESELQDKLRSILTPFDTSAIVVVNVEQNPYRFELPGLNLAIDDLTGSFGEGELDKEDIGKIQVRVRSRRAIPTDLRAALSEAIAIPTPKKEFLFDIIEVDVERSVSSLSDFGKVVTLVVRDRLLWIAIAMGALLTAIAVFALRSLRKVSQDTVNQLVEGLTPAPMPLQNEFESLTVESAVALLSDCYWCHQDDYAAWLWLRFPASLRTAVLERWTEARGYVKSLSSVVPAARSHHAHPNYLNPIDLSSVSQQGCEQWVRKNPGAWHALTPLRQAHIAMPLKERVRFEGTRTDSLKFPSPPTAQNKRVVTSAMEIVDLSDEDELALLADPSFVPVDLRKHVPSLVWVALLSPADRERLLAPVPAKDLAEVWMGPSRVLQIIEASLSPEKRKRVSECRTQIKPTRNSETMQYLVGQAVWLLIQQPSSGPIEPTRKAA